MENRKIVYGSTSDFLRYLSVRTKEKEKNNGNRYNRNSSSYESVKKPIDASRLSFE